jgi:hypothetical protein
VLVSFYISSLGCLFLLLHIIANQQEGDPDDSYGDASQEDHEVDEGVFPKLSEEDTPTQQVMEDISRFQLGDHIHCAEMFKRHVDHQVTCHYSQYNTG